MEPPMLPVNPSDLGVFSRLSDMMQNYHNYFRRTWKRLHDACNTPADVPPKLTNEQVVREGLFFCYRLVHHHDIEETLLFPLLARKMPEFQGDDAVALEQHRQIHHGVQALQEYLEKCRSRKLVFDFAKLKSKLDTWGDVLLLHLDQEVEMLSAENMRKYWTREEMLEFPV